MDKTHRIFLSTAAGLIVLAVPLAAQAGATPAGPVPVGPNGSVNLPVGIKPDTGQITLSPEYGPTGQQPTVPPPAINTDPGPSYDPGSDD